MKNHMHFNKYVLFKLTAKKFQVTHAFYSVYTLMICKGRYQIYASKNIL